MHKGDLIIADHPEAESSVLTRIYGIILEITKTGIVIIELADGSVIKRRSNSVAVYVQPPSNWKELYEQQEVLFSHSRQAMFGRSQDKKPAS